MDESFEINDVVMDKYGNIGIVVGLPFLMSQWVSVTFDGKLFIPMKFGRDYLEVLSKL